VQRRPPSWVPRYGFAMVSEMTLGLGYLAQYQGTPLKPWQIPCLAIAMLLTAYVGWVSYPLALYGLQKALGKGERKALERSRQPTKSFINKNSLGMPKNAFERPIAA
jgi:hypothetical protein